MGLHILDFLNSSPNAYIFRRTANKTNCGGFCFLAFALGIIGFSIYCIIKYTFQETYSIEHESYMYDFTHEIDISNKLIEFSYEILYLNINHHFSLFYCDTNETIPYNTSVSRAFDNLCFQLFYECQDDECTIKENIPENIIGVNIRYPMENLNLQEDNPVSLKKGGEIFLMTTYDYREYSFVFEETICVDKGIIEDKSTSIISPKNYYHFNFQLNESLTFNDKKYKSIGDISFVLDPTNWERYKRTKKSFLDTLSYICSIGNSIYSIIQTAFLFFYSKSFDNYKIIQNLLNNKEIKLKKEKNINKEIKSINNSDYLLNTHIDNDNKETIEENKDEENNKIIPEEISNESDTNLPKLSFISYLFNNIYCQKYCNMKNQILITKCNEIISKYYSIENIIYNQILMENFLKDYKWNDFKLKNIENNKLINNLKITLRNTYLNSNG